MRELQSDLSQTPPHPGMGGPTFFEVDDKGAGSLLVDNVAATESLEAWAVTVEPSGGAQQPTGAMVLLGSFEA